MCSIGNNDYYDARLSPHGEDGTKKPREWPKHLKKRQEIRLPKKSLPTRRWIGRSGTNQSRLVATVGRGRYSRAIGTTCQIANRYLNLPRRQTQVDKYPPRILFPGDRVSVYAMIGIEAVSKFCTSETHTCRDPSHFYRLLSIYFEDKKQNNKMCLRIALIEKTNWKFI